MGYCYLFCVSMILRAISNPNSKLIGVLHSYHFVALINYFPFFVLSKFQKLVCFEIDLLWIDLLWRFCFGD